MNEPQLSQKLTWITYLLAANLLAMVGCGCGLIFGLLPKVERAVKSTERVEARLQSFADEVQPVLTVGARTAAETIKNIDAKGIGETATQTGKTLIDAASERAKRYLEGEQKKKD